MKNFIITILILSYLFCSLNSELIPVMEDDFEIFIDENGGYPADTGRDEIIAELDLPEDLKGITCLDICFIPTQNKIYVYGSRKILVYDGTNLNFLQSIELSNNTKLSFPFPKVTKLKKMCYIPIYDLVASHSNEGKIVIIDPSIDAIINEINFTPFIQNQVSNNEYALKFNNRDNNLYLSFNCFYDNDYYSYLYCYNIDVLGNLNLNYDLSFEAGTRIVDFVFNPYRDRLYLNFLNQETKILNSFNGEEINSFPFDGTQCLCFVDKYPETSQILSVSKANNQVSLLSISSENDFFSEQFLLLSNNAITYEILHNDVNDKIYICSTDVIYYFDDQFSLLNPPQLHEIENISNLISSFTYDMDIETINNRLFVSHQNGISAINLGNHEVEASFDYKLNCFSNIIHNPINGKIYSISPRARLLTQIDTNLQIQHEIVGLNPNYGVYCSNENKLFLYSKPICASSVLTIFDLTNNSSTIIDDIPAISGLCYNETTNRVYIASCLESYIRVLDASTNNFLPNEYIYFTTSQDECQGMYLSPNQMLYCVLWSKKVAIIDLIQQPISIFYENLAFPGEGICDPNFVYDSENNYVWISLSYYPSPSYNKIVKYDDASPQPYIEHVIFEDPPSVVTIKKLKMVESVSGPCILFNANNKLWQLDQDLEYYDISPCTVYDFITSVSSVFIVTNGSETLSVLDLITNEYFQVQMPGCPILPFYNNINDKVYTFLVNPSDDFNYEIATLDCITNDVTITETGSYYYPNGDISGNIPYLRSEFILNPNENLLYLHPGDNVLKIIECDYDTKILSRGWNWESFPRLERDANGNVNAPDLFEEIQNFNSGVEHLETVAYNSNLNYYYDPGYWTSDPWFIQSPWLYKIDVDPEDDWILELSGERLSPDELVSSPDPQNPNFMGDGTWYWLGYWLTDSYDMDVAFPENVWQWVKHVKAEEWYYGIPENNRDPVIEPKPSNQMRALEYGKGYMVQFKTVDEGFPEDGLPPFQWSTGETSEGYERTQTENFDYNELPDYDVIDVLGIPENVIEIGVFQDTLCVGAVVVRDSSEQILVYVENSLREQVPYHFEVVTNNRSIEEVFDYSVFNNYEGIFEQGCLIAGSQPYSIVKFGNIGISHINTPNIDKIILNNNYPNPFNPETNISFSIPLDQKVKLTIYNLKGQKVKELINGQIVAGTHSVVWNGKDNNGKQVGSGLFFFKLKTDNKEISKKMLLLK